MPENVVISARGVTFTDPRGVQQLHDATLTVGAGEIVGVVGVEGAGQRELLRLLAGRLHPTAGRLDVPSEVGFVPEDRHAEGGLLDFSLAENVALRGSGRRHGRVRWREWVAETGRLLAAFDVRAPNAGVPLRALSGGNQQKLVLAREVRDRPAALVVENPTRGLDIRATAGVHRRLREARAGGAAVVVYSSDLDEVLTLADRVLVMHEGRVREAPADREAVGRLMLGAAQPGATADGATR